MPKSADTSFQDTLYPRAPSPPEDLLSPGGDSPCLAPQFTLKGAKAAKETTMEALRISIQNCVLSYITLYIRKQVFYFASLASFAVRLYKAKMTH